MEVMSTIGLVTRFFRKRVLCGASSAVFEFACKRKEKEEIESRYFLLKHDSCFNCRNSIIINHFKKLMVVNDLKNPSYEFLNIIMGQPSFSHRC
jgi:hypothetical protein